MINQNIQTATTDYLNILLSWGQLPLITLPSGNTQTSATLLDHIYTVTISNAIYEYCFPLTKTRLNKNEIPINQALLISRKKKNYSGPSLLNINNFKVFNSNYHSLIWTAKSEYFHDREAEESISDHTACT